MKNARLHKNAETSGLDSCNSKQDRGHEVTRTLEIPTSTVDCLTLPRREALVTVGAASCWRWTASDTAPKSIKIGPKVTCRDLAEIEYWLESLKNRKNQGIASKEIGGHKA